MIYLEKTKVCSTCGERKPITEYYKNAGRYDGVQVYCKACHKKYYHDYRHTSGQNKPMDEDRYCSDFLGVYVAEQVIAKTFKNVTRTPYGYQGYDLICGKGYKIDVKAACIGRPKGRHNRWIFGIYNNTDADYFMCIAFNNRDDLEPQHIWMIPGDKINHLVCFCITDVPRSLKKWQEYEKPIDKITSCCNVMKSEVVEKVPLIDMVSKGEDGAQSSLFSF